MKDLSLLQIKQTELAILRQFDAFCREHRICYFLSNGTLLGAVKYNGFIPWDDDVDVLVPRSDYDRLIKEFPSDGPLKLLCGERDDSYVFPFAKLCDTTTRITNQTILKDYHCGVHIDIFPLDGWHEDRTVAKKQAASLQATGRHLGMAIAQFSKGRTPLRTVVKTAYIVCARLIGYKRISAKLKKDIQIALGEAGDSTCGCVVWPVYGEGEIHPTSDFAQTVSVEFEGEMFPAPIGYDAYLRRLYGDYEQDPPLEKQKSHHHFRAYKIEDNEAM